MAGMARLLGTHDNVRASVMVAQIPSLVETVRGQQRLRVLHQCGPFATNRLSAMTPESYEPPIDNPSTAVPTEEVLVLGDSVNALDQFRSEIAPGAFASPGLPTHAMALS